MLIGILGLGSIGQRHGRNLMDLGHQVIAHDPAQLSHSRKEVIENSDAVLICTPTKQHANDLMDVLQARKHVLVEKPIGYDAPSYIAGMIMGARGAKPDLVVATGFMCRFHPEVQRSKQMLDKNHFGRIVGASFKVLQKNDRPEYLRDGVIRNWASHEIDLARYLLGNLEVMGCQTIRTDKGQDIAANIEIASIEHDFDFRVHADYLTAPEQRQFSLYGEKRTLTYDLTKDDWNKAYIEEMKALINKIDGKDAGPLADGYDGVAALELVMQARAKAGLDG